MYLGIDVGGTHTDAVVVDKAGVVLAAAKVSTNHEDLLCSVREVLENVLSKVDPEGIERLNLSTTLSTNIIVEEKIEDVGVLVSSGPGLAIEMIQVGGHFHGLSGSIDHRGVEVVPLSRDEADQAIAACRRDDVKVFAAVTKFSPRNPLQENYLKERLIDSGADFISLGHQFSGMLNFPRRVNTAYYNAAVWRTYNVFADAIEASVQEFCHHLPHIHILKADGGTMPFALSRETPVESILSGPAASVMGIIALCDIAADCVILDIGGTTTDIAVFADGAPLVEEGIEVGSHPTLVRALNTISIGVGGDSLIHCTDRQVQVGPQRLGPPLAFGGESPSLMDAFNFLDMVSLGDVDASKQGLERAASNWGMSPVIVARQALDHATASIKKAVDDLVNAINEKPVYTIMELLHDKRIEPGKVYLMGGPAKAFQHLLAKAFGLEVVVPENYDVANAIGAALARTTFEVELFADTEKLIMVIPNLDVTREIGPGFNLADAESKAKEYLLEHLASLGVEEDGDAVDILESTSFNMVDNDMRVGRNIRVRCQIRPGVVTT
jgi:N-methylhydantoinase A/oxoprolinase/acetone carboxylase beta subunit